MKPIKYRLMLGQLSAIQTSSLKVLASVILYVGRRAAKTIPQILVCDQMPNKGEPNSENFFSIGFTT